MKHSLSMIKHLFMNYLPIFSRWLWKYVIYIINISLLAQIIGIHFWWYLCSIFSFQPTKYSLLATDRLRNPPTLLRIIWKSLFFFQQCILTMGEEFLCDTWDSRHRSHPTLSRHRFFYRSAMSFVNIVPFLSWEWDTFWLVSSIF